MALQKTIDTAHGLTATDAYHKIIKVEADNVAGNIVLRVESYLNEQAYLDGNVPISKDAAIIDGVAYTNIRDQVFSTFYNHLKSLTSYTGSTDV